MTRSWCQNFQMQGAENVCLLKIGIFADFLSAAFSPGAPADRVVELTREAANVLATVTSQVSGLLASLLSLNYYSMVGEVLTWVDSIELHYRGACC